MPDQPLGIAVCIQDREKMRQEFSIGFFNRDGDLETAITIRTLVLKDGVAHIQVGAGIVADSDPPTEYQETINKANATLSAVAEAERMEALSRPSAKKLEVVA